MFPDCLAEEMSSGTEDAELPLGRFAAELDDLGIVSDDGDGAAEGCAGDLVAVELYVLPAHSVDFGLTVVAVVEELPLRGNRDVRHGLIDRKLQSLLNSEHYRWIISGDDLSSPSATLTATREHGKIEN